MNSDVLFQIYIFSLTLSLLSGIVLYHKTDAATRIIVLLLALSLTSEVIAEQFSIRYGNNMRVYHFFNPIELMVVSLYYNKTIKIFNSRNMGLYVGFSGIVLSVLNTLFLQSIYTLNSNFLLFEGFCIIAMSLMSYRSMFEDTDTNLTVNPHFWFSSIFLFISGITYTNWALYGIVGVRMVTMVPFLNTAILLVNTIAYLAFGLVFLLLPSKKRVK